MAIHKIKAQPGKQTAFQESEADIVFYGGAAGGGKTFALLMEHLRHREVDGFDSALFRRKLTDAKKPGSLYHEAKKLYRPLHPKVNKSEMTFTFTSKMGTSTLSIGHMEYEDDKENWDGSQICFAGFDELTHFTESQFWYIVQRNRSTCGVKPYIRATFNPDPDSWIKPIIKWWLDKNGEYADESKSGVLRWFVRVENELKWFDSEKAANYFILKNGLYDETKEGKKIPMHPTSFTFIPADVYDNEELLKRDPGYLTRLQSLPLVERLRKLKGNWKIKPKSGLLFKREWFEIVEAIPSKIQSVIRYWDRAGTDPEKQEKARKKNKKPSRTAGGLVCKTFNNTYYILDIRKFMKTPRDVRRNIKNTASQDGSEVDIWLEQEPGSSGIADVQDIIGMLDGYVARADKPTGSKIQRALPLSAQAEAGNVKLLRGEWNEDFLDEAENFDGSGSTRTDQIDCISGAYNKLQVQSKLLEMEDSVSEEAQKKTAKFQSLALRKTKGKKKPELKNKGHVEMLARINAKKQSKLKGEDFDD
jgi:predicted phage terminase large subunit-like protein